MAANSCGHPPRSWPQHRDLSLKPRPPSEVSPLSIETAAASVHRGTCPTATPWPRSTTKVGMRPHQAFLDLPTKDQWAGGKARMGTGDPVGFVKPQAGQPISGIDGVFRPMPGDAHRHTRARPESSSPCERHGGGPHCSCDSMSLFRSIVSTPIRGRGVHMRTLALSIALAAPLAGCTPTDGSLDSGTGGSPSQEGAMDPYSDYSGEYQLVVFGDSSAIAAGTLTIQVDESYEIDGSWNITPPRT